VCGYMAHTTPKHTDEWSTEMKRKMHPADIADRERIAEAVEFTAFLRLGPHHKIVERAQTLADAALLANHIEDQHPGRKALVYAVLVNGVSIPVPADMRQAALNPATEDEDMTIKPLSAIQIAQLTAIITGGGYKRPNSRVAAIKRFMKTAVGAGVKAAEGFLGMPFDKACEELRAELEILKGGGRPAHTNAKPSSTPHFEADPIEDAMRKFIGSDVRDDDFMRDLFREVFEAGRAARSRRPTGRSGPTKREIAANLLQRPEGCTSRDILDATGWPAVSVPAIAKASGLTLRQEKDGRVTRYYGVPL